MSNSSPLPFSSLPLSPEILAVVDELGFQHMTDIQAQSILPLLEGRDLLGQSQTGSGKTAAFALPILQRLNLQEREVQALILCPTRELAAQVAREIRTLGRRFEGLQVSVLSGGASSRDQTQSLQNGAHLVVGTPGRVLDLAQKGKLQFGFLRSFVLDEADKMLDMGFEEDLKAIVSELPPGRQTILFSATFPASITALSSAMQVDPVVVRVSAEKTESLIEQQCYDMGTEDKKDLLMRVLQQASAQAVLIFCNQKATVDTITDLLARQNVPVAALHGDFEQRDRDRVMAMFRNSSLRILVATDVAARGLDIEHLDLVINYDFPLTPETYVHRIGRTGRAGKSGVSILFTKANDALKIHELEKLTGSKMSQPRLGFKNQHGLGADYGVSLMRTLWISGGRKDKLRPGDIVGALTGTTGGLRAEDVGKIEIHDHFSYVAVKQGLAKSAFTTLRDGRIKAKKFQVRLLG